MQSPILITGFEGSIWDVQLTTKLGSNTISLDVSTYPSGTYLVTIKNSETNIILKLAKL